MKKIGIIGGAGPEAGSLLFTTIVRLYQQQGSWKDNDFPQMVLLNYPFSEMLVQADKNILTQELQDAVNQLESIGCEIIVIACNTLHVFVPFIKFKAQFFSIVDSVLAEAEKRKINSALFIGTLTSSFTHLYNNKKIKIIDLEFLAINDLIESILKNQYSEESAYLLSKIINQKKSTFDAIILGCTEFSVLHQKYPLKTNKIILDSTELLARVILKNV